MKSKSSLSAQFLISGAIFMAGCSQLPPHVSMTNQARVNGSVSSFGRCAVSVHFSGSPRALNQYEAADFAAPLTKFAKWEIEGLAYEEYRLVEYAVCICRDYDFSISDISQTETSLRNNRNFKIRKATDVPFANKVIEFESASTPSDVGEHVRLLFPTKAPRCTFAQGVRFGANATDASKIFFATTEPYSVERPDGRSSDRPAKQKSVADRLEALRDLRQRDLITQQEYEKRRKAILEEL